VNAFLRAAREEQEAAALDGLAGYRMQAKKQAEQKFQDTPRALARQAVAMPKKEQ